jgi:hypothetical protein
MHLAGQADSGHATHRGRPRAGSQLVQRVTGRRPPGGGLLLRPLRVRARDHQRRRLLRQDRMVFGEQHHLDLGGTEIDSEKVHAKNGPATDLIFLSN